MLMNSNRKLIDADAVIEIQMYDEEKEDFYTEKMVWVSKVTQINLKGYLK